MRSSCVLSEIGLRAARAPPRRDRAPPPARCQLALPFTGRRAGGLNALGIVAGAVWQLTPFADVPIHVGATIELGPHFLRSGARDVGFLVRGGAIASWTPTPQLQLEIALPEIGVITNGPGAFVVGGAIRGGYRF